MPANMVIASTPMITRVPAAFLLLGGLKLGTPLLTASTPVSAVQPWANARSTSATRSSPLVFWVARIPKCADSAIGVWPVRAWYAPTTIISTTLATNPYVGTAKAVPDSLRPRRFTIASSTTATLEITTVYGLSTGKAEAMLATPATTETATVST